MRVALDGCDDGWQQAGATDSNWYRNVLKEPAIRVVAGTTQLIERATPITDPARVSEVLDMFRARYGAREVAAYYPKPNVALEARVRLRA